MVRSCSVKNFQVFNSFFCNSLIVFSRQTAYFVFLFIKTVLYNYEKKIAVTFREKKPAVKYFTN